MYIKEKLEGLGQPTENQSTHKEDSQPTESQSTHKEDKELGRVESGCQDMP